MTVSTKKYYLSKTNQDLFDFHKALDNNDLSYCNFINFIDIDTKIKYYEINKKGYLSLIIKYLILIKNNNWLKLILDKYINYLRINDCLILIEYLNNNNLVDYNSELFFNIHLNKWHFSSKSIKFLINNNLNKYLINLNGYYSNIEDIKDIKNKSLISDFSKLKDYYKNINMDKYILLCIQKINNKKKIDSYLTNINNFLNSLKNCKNYIILDCGNILHCLSNGKINHKSYEYMLKLIEYLFEKNFTPIIIIHNRHLNKKLIKDNNILNLINYLESNYDNFIFKTPYNENDDYFILIISFMIRSKIITKDNFGDHLHLFTDSEKNPSYQINQLIKDIIIDYYFDKKNNLYFCNNINKQYSSCIQYIDDKIYIPNNNNFIEINC